MSKRILVVEDQEDSRRILRDLLHDYKRNGTTTLFAALDVKTGKVTRQQIRRGVFKSVAELEAAIETWLVERNTNPKPFKWTAKANTILVHRFDEIIWVGFIFDGMTCSLTA